VAAPPANLAPGVRAIGVPWSVIAQGLGRVMVKNIVALGVLQAATGLLPAESILTAIRQALVGRPELLALDEAAFARGAAALPGSSQA
jgi:2-oxoisovalerate ferredoxin oxidoreductase beta subunit